MLERFVKDQSGMALGLAVVMIVLIGVMGAGLLVFVQSDLEAVVEVNQGRKALEVADAGAQAARVRLTRDVRAAHYDVDDSSTPHPLYYGTSCNKDSTDSWEPSGTNPDPIEAWSPETGGVTRTFAGGQFNVTIRWLSTDAAADSRCVAPVTGADAAGFDYFEVVSTGTYSGTTRKVEVIYNTYALQVPKAYYTPGDIEVKGSACIDSVSLFTSSNITIAGDGLGCGNGSKIRGNDLNYKAWAAPSYPNNFNATLRGTELAGFGALGQISGSSSMGTRDFDGDTPADADGPDFVKTPSNPQLATEVTFPFNLNNQPNAEALCDSVRELGAPHYIKDNSTTNATVSLSTWPANSNSDTVVCYEFTDPTAIHTLKWDVSGEYTYPTGHPYEGCRGDPRQGTLVVKGGNFTTQSNKAILKGIVVVRGQAGSGGSSTDTGKTCLDGFVNATGKITIAGSVKPSTSFEGEDRPGFYGVRTWSWRELYE